MLVRVLLQIVELARLRPVEDHEGDDTDADILRLFVDERSGGRLRRFHPNTVPLTGSISIVSEMRAASSLVVFVAEEA